MKQGSTNPSKEYNATVSVGSMDVVSVSAIGALTGSQWLCFCVLLISFGSVIRDLNLSVTVVLYIVIFCFDRVLLALPLCVTVDHLSRRLNSVWRQTGTTSMTTSMPPTKC